MKALVKRRAERGLWLEDVPEPTVGNQRRAHSGSQNRHLRNDLHIYNWDAWAAKTIPVPWSSATSSSARSSRWVERRGLLSGADRERRGHVVCGRCRNCLAGRRHICALTKGVGVDRPGAFAEYLSLPMTNVWVHPRRSDVRDVAAIFDPFGNACTPPVVSVLGEDVLITGAGPIGIMAAAVARTRVPATSSSPT